ncbi:phytase [Actinomadura sp.]|uniref:phytase n=2 Tax=Actinomadura sp. TaxID=1989 RepID=UPI0037C5960F
MHLRPTPEGVRLAAAATTVALAAAVLPAVPAAADGDELAQVRATLETPPNFDDEAGGNANADDPAIWSHPDDRDGDLVIATLKEGGLVVYDAAGREIQRFAAPAPPRAGDEPGRFNNVDLIYGFQLGRRKVDLAVVSDRGRDTVRSYVIDPDKAEDHRAPLTDVTDPSVPFVFSSSLDDVNEQATAYGLASWGDSDGGGYVALSRRHTSRLGLVRLVATRAGTITYRHVRDLDLPTSFPVPGGTWTPCEDPGEGPQVEGMVADPEHRVLYAAQEDVGIWRIPLKGAPRLIDRVKEYGVPAAYNPETDECEPTGPDPGVGGEHITADAEGLTIYRQDGGDGYLIASSQGDNTFVVYDREDPTHYIGRFRVAPGTTVDGSEVCDGAMVTSAPVGRFRNGLLVVHDGENSPEAVDENGEVRENTNFKFVAWEDVAQPLDLDITPGDWDPRD